jgi:hypothetical protein
MEVLQHVGQWAFSFGKDTVIGIPSGIVSYVIYRKLVPEAEIEVKRKLRRERRTDMARHIKSGHTGRFAHCAACPSPQTGSDRSALVTASL